MKIESKDLFDSIKKQHTATLAAAFKSGEPDQMAQAMTGFFDAMNEAVCQRAAEEAEARNQDTAVLAARGANVLTAEERDYYTGLAKCLKSADPRAAVTNYEKAMPQTTIERIVGMIKKTHPLLDKINFVSTPYLTRVLANAKPGQLAAWGKITDGVKKEIEGAVKEISMTMCKLSAFMAISMDLIELGPEWMDVYARETLSEAIACALETACVIGTGKDEPVGMIRDISPSASVQDGVYPKQEPVKVTRLDTSTMGSLVARLARDPNDETGKKSRSVDPRDIILVFNPFDYWEKVFAAITRLVNGQFIQVLPIPAEIFQCEGLEKGEAVIGIAPYYFAGIGPSGKEGTITADDSVKFIEDQRAYKAKLQGNGRPLDHYAFQRLDVSELEPVATTVEVAGVVKTQEQAAE